MYVKFGIYVCVYVCIYVCMCVYVCVYLVNTLHNDTNIISYSLGNSINRNKIMYAIFHQIVRYGDLLYNVEC